nr:transcription factor TCP4-like [Ipomoea batatas]
MLGCDDGEGEDMVDMRECYDGKGEENSSIRSKKTKISPILSRNLAYSTPSSVEGRNDSDRPCKAVDWLIKKAKPAINELVELPSSKPNTANPNFDQEDAHKQHQETIGNPILLTCNSD